MDQVLETGVVLGVTPTQVSIPSTFVHLVNQAVAYSDSLGAYSEN